MMGHLDRLCCLTRWLVVIVWRWASICFQAIHSTYCSLCSLLLFYHSYFVTVYSSCFSSSMIIVYMLAFFIVLYDTILSDSARTIISLNNSCTLSNLYVQIPSNVAPCS